MLVAEGGTPEGNIFEPRVLGDVLTMLLTERMRELASRARGPSGGMFDSRRSRIVPTEPLVPVPDPREDAQAGQLATLIGYVQSEGRG